MYQTFLLENVSLIVYFSVLNMVTLILFRENRLKGCCHINLLKSTTSHLPPYFFREIKSDLRTSIFNVHFDVNFVNIPISYTFHTNWVFLHKSWRVWIKKTILDNIKIVVLFALCTFVVCKLSYWILYFNIHQVIF